MLRAWKQTNHTGIKLQTFSWRHCSDVSNSGKISITFHAASNFNVTRHFLRNHLDVNKMVEWLIYYLKRNKKDMRNTMVCKHLVWLLLWVHTRGWNYIYFFVVRSTTSFNFCIDCRVVVNLPTKGLGSANKWRGF